MAESMFSSKGVCGGLSMFMCIGGELCGQLGSTVAKCCSRKLGRNRNFHLGRLSDAMGAVVAAYEFPTII
uniref:Uncharacterized protein n=1 Tax=Physcomitrium patens TaxID=3218 RepID=A0A2K1ITQ5_PHYPA|nr:hypothetical protein PHYPA_024601 [Physcomitrium patens]